MKKSSCIKLHTLARYIKGILSEKEKEEFEAHLSVCSACLDEFVMANALIRDENLIEYDEAPVSDDAVRSVMQKVKDNIKKFYKWSKRAFSETLPSPDFASVRSDIISPSEHIHLSKKIGELQIDMFIEKTENDMVCIRARLSENNAKTKNVRLTFIREESSMFSRLLKDGDELFENLYFGYYRLTLTQHAMEKGNYDFRISQEGIYEL